MSAFYPGLAKTAKQLFKQFGKKITIKRVVVGEYNPTTGVPQTETLFTPYGQVFAYRNSEIDGFNILTGDRRVVIAELGLGYVPNPTTDMVVIDGEDHTIVSSKRAVHEEVVLELQVRR